MYEPTKLHSDLAYFEDEVQEIMRRPVVKDSALFYGSSSIRLWGVERLARDMAPVVALNHGIGGSTADQCLYRYGELVKPYAPKLLVWYCGTNDIALGYTPEEAFALSLRVFEWTRRDNPECKILALSVMHNRSRERIYPQHLILNELLKWYCRDNEFARHVDLIETLCHDKDGQVRGDIFMPDELHLNDKGYAELAAIVRPAVLDMMGV
ncbi:lysophospholipase [Clostridia bacterium]|nr:lysophospholipase [Clostridia bacterium]